MTYNHALHVLLYDFKRLGVSASLCLSCSSSATSVLLHPHVGFSSNFLINFVLILKKASCSNKARITLSRRKSQNILAARLVFTVSLNGWLRDTDCWATGTRFMFFENCTSLQYTMSALAITVLTFTSESKKSCLIIITLATTYWNLWKVRPCKTFRVLRHSWTQSKGITPPWLWLMFGCNGFVWRSVNKNNIVIFAASKGAYNFAFQFGCRAAVRPIFSRVRRNCWNFSFSRSESNFK